MASRPPTLRTLALRAIVDHGLFGRGDLVLCACSGGPDSSALLHALATLRGRIGHHLEAFGVDHGLRPEAAGELDRARAIADAHGVPMSSAALSLAAGSNLQARARKARHEALQAHAAARGAAAIALGHTADDRAETVLMRILRGTGIAGLAAMPRKSAPPWGSIPLVRPLLAARRADVSLHLGRHGITAAHDPSNEDRRFLRTRVRHELMPLLETLSPGVAGHLCALADAASQSGRAPQGEGTEPGDPLSALNRAQREALERAIRLRQGATRVRIAGGRELRVAFVGGIPVVFVD